MPRACTVGSTDNELCEHLPTEARQGWQGHGAGRGQQGRQEQLLWEGTERDWGWSKGLE